MLMFILEANNNHIFAIGEKLAVIYFVVGVSGIESFEISPSLILLESLILTSSIYPK